MSLRLPLQWVTGLYLILAIGSPPATALPSGLTERPDNPTCIAPDRPQPTGSIILKTIATLDELSFPIDMLQAPNDASRFYVVDRDGIIATYKKQSDDTFIREGTFVDISDRILRDFDGRERLELGLLGMVFHPNFANNGYVYLYYSGEGSSEALQARLSRFSVNPDGQSLDPSSEEFILTVERDNQFHWGGRPTFGADGHLYITLGDSGSGTFSQDVNNINGKMLRIDVDGGFPYAIPPDNPFAHGGGLGEIYAYGFRNPWRWSFDSLTNEIWLGDVGPATWEEIDKVEKGGNYGWNILAGNHCTNEVPCIVDNLVAPELEYPHDSNEPVSGDAVIGGYVYRGNTMSDLYGMYVFGDVNGRIFGYDSNGGNPAQLLYDSGQFILAFAQGIDDNELYVLAQGKILSLSSNVGGQPPDNFPQTLSATGCFDPLDPTQPVAGLIPYDVNVPLWSDGAVKNRWMAIPDGTTIEIDEHGDFRFPIGTVLAKNFDIDQQLIETRLFMRHDDGEWGGYSYEWNSSGSDATLVAPEGKTEIIGSQTWLYPSRGQCFACHTQSTGRSIGPEIAQLNKLLTYPSTAIEANQLETLEHISLLEHPLPDSIENLDALADITDQNTAIEQRARGYLHANCAMCHRPGGPAQGAIDFRYSIPLVKMGAVDIPPSQGDLGVQNAHLAALAEPEQSIISLRMHTLDPLHRMPPLASEQVDPVGTQVVDDWIRSMEGLIGNRVWEDLNQNGIQNSGEPGLIDIGIQISDCMDVAIGSTSTDINGEFLFAATAGQYKLDFVLPLGFIFSPQLQGSKRGQDSNPDAASGQTTCFSLSDGQRKLGIDAGLIRQAGGSGNIGNYVWNDLDKDGVQDAGEPGLADVSVKLLDCNDNELATMLSDTNGFYLFEGISAGQYKILFSAPTDFSFSPALQGTKRSRDSNPDSTTGLTACFSMTQNQMRPGMDAGLFMSNGNVASAQVGNFVWHDVDADGRQDSNEPGKSGVIVNLLDCSNSLLDSTTTNNKGKYFFKNLEIGNYKLEYIAPAGYIFSSRYSTNRRKDSDPFPDTGRTACYSISEGQTRFNIDAGLKSM